MNVANAKFYLLVIAALGAASGTQAAVYDFSYSATGGPSGTEIGSGTFTANDSPVAGPFQITSISGSASGSLSDGGATSVITGLSSALRADNLLFATGPLVDLGGISLVAGSATYNIFSSGSAYYVLSSVLNTASTSQASLATFTVTEVAGGVPEPASWVLMIGGFGLVGAHLRARRVMAGA